jgi:SET domain-containing protein
LQSSPYRVGRARTGLGLFATAPIKKGTWVIEYTGPRLTNAEADRKQNYGGRYLFEVNSRWTIDGYPRSNIARYANHSCRPNMEAEIVRGRVKLRAIRRIKPGDELTYDYGRDYLDLFIPVCKCATCGNHRHRHPRKAKAKNGRAPRRN